MKKDTKKLLGLAVLGVGAWYLLTRAGSSSSSTTALATAAARAPRPFGDPSDPNSVAYACNTARHMMALGQSTPAAYWQQKCAAGGGSVPADMGHLYT